MKNTLPEISQKLPVRPKGLPEGYRLFITHFRRFESSEFFMTKYNALTEDVGSPLSHGGVTEAVIADPEGNIVSTGLASCCERDHFSKKIGRDIATGRALKKLLAIEG